MVLTLDTNGNEPNMDALIALYGMDVFDITDDKQAITDGKQVITDDKQVITDDKQAIIVQYLRQHRDARTIDIAEVLGLSVTQTKHYIKQLLKDGRILSNGANKNRTYSINETLITGHIL